MTDQLPAYPVTSQNVVGDRRMRAQAVVGEAWRDLATGTARAALFAAVFTVVVGMLALADVRSVVQILRGAASFRAAGASVQVLKAQVDGRRCDALSGVGAISSAGALRQGSPVQILNLPSSQINLIEATPGLVAMLPLIAEPVSYDPEASGGVWLSADLARVLGAGPGTVVRTAAGDATVAGVYTWGDDGRARDLGYAMVAPVPPDGAFTQCWSQIWPGDQALAGLSYVSVANSGQGMQAILGQLNTSLGISYDAGTLLRDRLTARAPWMAAVVGLALGFVAARARRLEIASSLHARVPRSDLMWQHLLEAVAWVAAASAVAAAALLWAARFGNPDPGWTTWATGLRTVAAGGAATLIGVLLGVLAAREKHLFKYAKDR